MSRASWSAVHLRLEFGGGLGPQEARPAAALLVVAGVDVERGQARQGLAGLQHAQGPDDRRPGQPALQVQSRDEVCNRGRIADSPAGPRGVGPHHAILALQGLVEQRQHLAAGILEHAAGEIAAVRAEGSSS